MDRCQATTPTVQTAAKRITLWHAEDGSPVRQKGGRVSQLRSDRDMAAALARGDKVVFTALFRRYNGALTGVCASIVRNRATAEEVVQDTWLAVLKEASDFEGRSSLASWIFAIACNKARTRVKRDRRTVSFDDYGDDHGLAAAFDGHGRWSRMPELWDDATPERIVQGRELVAHVNRAIDTLPAAQRAVLILWGCRDLDSHEICTILKVSPENLRVLLHRARVGLRKRLDEIMPRPDT